MPTMTSLAWSCRQCPPLRSVLLASTSNHANSRKRVLVVVAQREEVLVGIVVDEALHRADAERAVAQHGERHDVPARARRRARTPRPRAGTACPAGSPRAAAHRDAACRSRRAPRRRPSPRRGRSRSTSSACGRRPRARRSRARRAARRGSVPARTPVPGRIHRLLAQRARRTTTGDGLGAAGGHGPHLRTGARRCARRSPRRPRRRRRRRRRLPPRDALAQLDEHELALGIEAEADEPGPEQRDRRLAQRALRLREVERQLGVLVGDLVEERHRLGRRAGRPAPSRRAR